MIATARKPTSIAGIKRLAKELKKQVNITHFQALNMASQLAGFHNFNHAVTSLSQPSRTMPSAHRHQVTISARWRGWEGSAGNVQVSVPLTKPLQQLIVPQILIGPLSGLVATGPETLSFKKVLPGEGHTEMRVYTAARAVRFMSTTGLIPTAVPRNALPFFEDEYGSQGKIPKGDHTRFWTDPVSGHQLVTDEPYFGEDTPQSIKAQRIEWAHEHHLSVGFPKWPGMHNPGCGTRLTLFSQDLDVAHFVTALDRRPSPGEGIDVSLLEPDFRKPL